MCHQYTDGNYFFVSKTRLPQKKFFVLLIKCYFYPDKEVFFLLLLLLGHLNNYPMNCEVQRLNFCTVCGQITSKSNSSGRRRNISKYKLQCNIEMVVYRVQQFFLLSFLKYLCKVFYSKKCDVFSGLLFGV